MFGKRNRHPRATMNHPNPLTLAAFALAASLSLASPTFGGSQEDVAATPLKAVFQHVNSRPGKPAPEVITDTPEKLEARYRRGGESHVYVLLLHSQSADRAEVWVGLQDAGVDTIWKLKRKANTWEIISTDETGFWEKSGSQPSGLRGLLRRDARGAES